jgi:anti-sigma factor RsiW
VKSIQSAPYFRAPAELRDWAQALTGPVARAPRRRAALAASLALGLALGAALGVGVSHRLTAMHAERDRAGEVVASYVRSQLLPERLTDVASSDRHVVKPWFNGKLDFAPPVQDFTGEGFPLLGGRLDYLGERAVAVLVYRHRQHTVNLVVWPARDATASAVESVSIHGYTLLHWRRAGLEHWLVSDLSAAALASFSQILQRP